MTAIRVRSNSSVQSRLPDIAIIVVLACFFAFAGIDKLAHYSGFVTAIDSYRILPIPIGRHLAPALIAMELGIAVGICVRAWRRIAALHAAVLMVVFTIGLADNRLAGSEALCGCWFSISMAQGDVHFLLNSLMIAMSLVVWRSAPLPAPAPVGSPVATPSREVGDAAR